MARRSDNGRILIWEVMGIFFIIIVGSLLHFTYEWSGRSPVVGMFAPVNESVWEHLKLGFWSLVIYSLLEYWFVRRKTKNFFTAKAAGILSLQLLIIVVFYGYTTFTGREILAIDITSYVTGAIICQLVGYRLLTRPRLPGTATAISVAFIVSHALILMVFTFRPPELPIFRDSHTGKYGTGWRTYRPTEEDNHQRH